MILGLLSDSHGNRPRTEAALALLRQHRAQHLIHCGDLGSEDILTLLFEQQEHGTPVTAVPGNVDEWDPGLILYAKKLGIPLPRTARLEIDTLRIAVTHGHDKEAYTRLLDEPGLNLLFTGHTHLTRDETLGTLRILNPGALHRTPDPGCALYDTATGRWTRLSLP